MNELDTFALCLQFVCQRECSLYFRKKERNPLNNAFSKKIGTPQPSLEKKDRPPDQNLSTKDSSLLWKGHWKKDRRKPCKKPLTKMCRNSLRQGWGVIQAALHKKIRNLAKRIGAKWAAPCLMIFSNRQVPSPPQAVP